MTYTIAVCTVLDSWWWTEHCPKHVEFYSNSKYWEVSASRWFHYKNMSRCTVLWMSNWGQIMQYIFTYGTGMCSYLSKISSKIQIFNSGHLSYGHFIFTWKRMRWSVILFEAERDQRAKKLYEALCCTFGCVFSQPVTFLAWTSLTFRRLTSTIVGVPHR